jgi:hypothetical protein
MLISPSGTRLSIKAPIDLPQNWTQLLIDSEILFADMGLVFDLRCIPCLRVGDTEGAYCVGDVNAEHNVFSITCGCRSRVGRGLFTAPQPPRMTYARERTEDKREEVIPRDIMKQIEAFETVLKQLDLQYLVRCLRCRLENRSSDGVRGAKGANASEFHLTCDCTDRVYRGADTPILTH